MLLATPPLTTTAFTVTPLSRKRVIHRFVRIVNWPNAASKNALPTARLSASDGESPNEARTRDVADPRPENEKTSDDVRIGGREIGGAAGDADGEDATKASRAAPGEPLPRDQSTSRSLQTLSIVFLHNALSFWPRYEGIRQTLLLHRRCQPGFRNQKSTAPGLEGYALQRRAASRMGIPVAHSP